MESIARTFQAVKSQNAAPRARISARQDQRNGRWYFVKQAPTGTIRTSRDSWETEWEAIYTAALGQDLSGLTIQASSHAKDSLIAVWQQQGIELALDGFGVEHCANSYQRQGWEGVRIPVFGWPQPATMEAA